MADTAPALKVLLIEDDPDDAFLVRETLSETRGVRIDLEVVDRLSPGLARLSTGDIDVALLDLSLPDSHGLDGLAEAHSKAPNVPIIILTGLNDESLAIEAVRKGAQDYLVKGQFGALLLERSLLYARERNRLLRNLEARMKDLRASEDRLRKVIRNNADGIVILDTSGTVRLANPAAAAILQRDPNVLSMVSSSFPVAAQETRELTVGDPEDAQTIVEMRVVETDWEDEPAYLATLRDVTERKRILEENARLEMLVQTARALTHHIRNALSPIIGRAEAFDESTPGAATNLKTSALAGARRIEAVLDAVTEMAKSGNVGLTEYPGAQNMLDIEPSIRRHMKDGLGE